LSITVSPDLYVGVTTSSSSGSSSTPLNKSEALIGFAGAASDGTTSSESSPFSVGNSAGTSSSLAEKVISPSPSSVKSKYPSSSSFCNSSEAVLTSSAL